MSLILKAAQFAAHAHKGQKRKYNKDPYIYHPSRVAARTAILPGATDEMVAAAFLHDVLEDTPVTAEELEREFGEAVYRLVFELTNPSKGSKLLRAERKKLDVDHLKKVSTQAKKIKLLDRLDNVRELSISKDREFALLYAQESRALLDAVADAAPDLAGELKRAINRLEEHLSW
jgi:(p)ppGpp synthase/HD superfamily hydrolase